MTFVATEVHRRGGMERSLAEVIDRLVARGWKVTVIARSCELDHPELTVRRLPVPRRPFVVAYPLFVVLASLVLMRRRSAVSCVVGANVLLSVDVCVVQFCHAAFQSLGRVRRRRRDTVAGRLSDAVGRRLTLAVERWAYRPGRVRRYVAVSPLIADELMRWYRVPGTHVTVVPNGVDPDGFRPDAHRRGRVRRELGVDDAMHVALFMGGDWSRKGLEIAIDAVAAAPGWALVVAGDGDSAHYGARAAACGARAVFTGLTSSPEELFAAADAFVLPTFYEGFALVTLEAASSGLPVLTTKASGAQDLMAAAGGDERFLPPDAAAFAGALRRLDDDDVRWAEGAAFRAASAQFDWTRIAQAYDRVLRDASRVGA